MNNQRTLWTPLLLGLLALAGIALSVLTLDIHIKIILDPTLAPSYCHLSDRINCASVIGSPYSVFLGVPLGSYGGVFYFVILLLAYYLSRSDKRDTILAPLLTLSAASVITSIGLFLLSEFVIHALCPVCIAMYLVNLLLFIVCAVASRSCSLPTSIVMGARTILRFPFVALGLDKSEGSVGTVRRGVLCAVAIGILFYFLPSILYVRVVRSEEFQSHRKNSLDTIVSQWESAVVQDIPIVTSDPLFSDAVKGPANASITVVEFSDYQCPACRRFSVGFDEIYKEYKEVVRVVHKDFPIDNACNPLIPHSVHEFACTAAFSARCAGEQGKFWEMNAFLFSEKSIELKDAAAFAKALDAQVSSLGLDRIGYNECINSKRQESKIQSDVRLAEKLKLEGTPSVWINGKVVESVHPQVLKAIFDRVLGK